MRIIGILFLFLIQFPSIAQDSKINYLIEKIERQKIVKYKVDSTMKYFLVSSKFSKDSLTNYPTSADRIVSIEYVYSANNIHMEFNQHELDKSRMTKLFRSYPSFNNDLIKWNYFEQTGCKEEDCEKYFHGFVVYFETRPPTIESVKSEIDSIKAALANLDKMLADIAEAAAHHNYKTHKKTGKSRTSISMGSLKSNKFSCSYPQVKSKLQSVAKKYKDHFKGSDRLKGSYTIEIEIDVKGRIKNTVIENLHVSQKEELNKFLKQNISFIPASFNNKKYEGTISGTIKLPIGKKSFTLNTFHFPEKIQEHYYFLKGAGYNCQACDLNSKNTSGHMMASSTISDVLERNKSWDNSLFICDISSSMYPYTIDILIWAKENLTKGAKQFVFFNDGDLKMQHEKMIGKTGGIYSVKTTNFSKLKEVVITAMESGNGGGDIPENNFEALLEGQNLCKECKDVVMVADNYSFPRDSILLESYKGKLNFILCGTERGINVKYLDIARMYNFSIHTMKSDISGLSRIKEGEFIEIDNLKYMLNEGKFIRKYDDSNY